MVESVTCLGKNSGSRPVLVRLCSPLQRPHIFEKSKIFATMGISVTHYKSKLERQERRALIETRRSLQGRGYEVIFSSGDFEIMGKTLFKEDIHATKAEGPPNATDKFLEARRIVKKPIGRHKRDKVGSIRPPHLKDHIVREMI